MEQDEKSNKSIDQFDDNYEYFRNCGFSHVEATNKARDEWRKNQQIKECHECHGVGTIEIDGDNFRCCNCHGKGWTRYARVIHTPSFDDEEGNQDEFLGADSRFGPVELASFNQRMTKMLKALDKEPMTKKYFVLLCRARGFDQYFNEEVYELANEIILDNPDAPEYYSIAREQDIAQILGYKLKANKGSVLGTLQRKLKEIWKEAFPDE